MKSNKQSFRRLSHSVLAIALFYSASAAFAQNSDCDRVNQSIRSAQQNTMDAYRPRSDPGSYVQQNFDIRGILSQDVTKGFSFLSGLDFGGLAMSIINRSLNSIVSNGVTYFTSKVNQTLNDAYTTVTGGGAGSGGGGAPATGPGTSTPVTGPYALPGGFGQTPAPAPDPAPAPAPSTVPIAAPYKGVIGPYGPLSSPPGK